MIDETLHSSILIYNFLYLLLPVAFRHLCNISVPPSFQDGGAWERGNAHWGRVETPQNFGVFWETGGQEGVEVPNIGGSVSKIMK